MALQEIRENTYLRDISCHHCFLHRDSPQASLQSTKTQRVQKRKINERTQRTDNAVPCHETFDDFMHHKRIISGQ